MSCTCLISWEQVCKGSIFGWLTNFVFLFISPQLSRGSGFLRMSGGESTMRSRGMSMRTTWRRTVMVRPGCGSSHLHPFMFFSWLCLTWYWGNGRPNAWMAKSSCVKKSPSHFTWGKTYLYESESLKTDLCEVLKLWRLTLIQPCTNQNKTAICMKTEFSSGSWRNFMVCGPQASGPRQGAWDTKPSQSVHLWWTPDWQSSLWFPVWCDIVAVTVSYPRTANYKGETGFYVLR